MQMDPGQSDKPLIVGIGGTTRPGSSSERVLRGALREVELLGGRTEIFAGLDLAFPIFAPEDSQRHPGALKLIASLRACDGIIVASPGYHGSMSGLIKNALDYTEDMVSDPSPYFDGRPFGCIACAYGWQATGSTLAALRSVAHALRAWPTPLGIAVNSMNKIFDASGRCTDETLSANLKLMARQIMWFVGNSRRPAQYPADPPRLHAGVGQANAAVG